MRHGSESTIVGFRIGAKGLTQGLLGGVGLQMEELAADVMFLGQLRDGLHPHEYFDSHILPLLSEAASAGLAIES
jgi:hypothetical protein